jgi:hypothetical protein
MDMVCFSTQSFSLVQDLIQPLPEKKKKAKNWVVVFWVLLSGLSGVSGLFLQKEKREIAKSRSPAVFFLLRAVFAQTAQTAQTTPAFSEATLFRFFFPGVDQVKKW